MKSTINFISLESLQKDLFNDIHKFVDCNAKLFIFDIFAKIEGENLSRIKAFLSRIRVLKFEKYYKFHIVRKLAERPFQ